VRREQKITVGEMREMGVHRLPIYCADYHSSHWLAITLTGSPTV
jgi:hypothetical protein